MFKALFYAYVLGGLTFIPLMIGLVIFIAIYTSVPVGDPDLAKGERKRLERTAVLDGKDGEVAQQDGAGAAAEQPLDTNDLPTTRKGWLTMRRTFEETDDNTSYVTLVRSFLDSRSKDPRRSRPKDMWFVVLKRNILYLYEDEGMTECGAVIELGRHNVLIYPEGLPDAELFAKRNAICIRQKPFSNSPNLPSLTKEMKSAEDVEEKLDKTKGSIAKKEKEREVLLEVEKLKDAAREEAFDPSTAWYIFTSSNVEMEDWYLSLVHASTQPSQTPTLLPLRPVFDPKDMNHLVSTLDDQPDVIPMRWLNALLGRIFFSHYRTHNLEEYIIGRLMKKIEKVKRPQFLTRIAVTEVSVGNRPPMLSKPMLKELSKEGDAALEVHFQYKGEIRITVEATAVINLGARFKSYTVDLSLAVVLKELEGNLLVKVKRPPSNRIWYAFTQTPRMVLEVEPIVSDRQITWGMILSTIESKIKEVIQESVVMPNMDDIAYFDSIPYEHRGGIWADASRQAKPAPSETAPSTLDDVGSAASAPLPKISTSVEPPIPTSQSEETVPIKATPSTSTQDANVPDLVVDDPAESRLKTWFSSVRSDDGKSASAPELIVPTANDDDLSDNERGRTELKTGDEGDRQRSQSRARSIRSVKSEKSTTSEHVSLSPETRSLRRSLSRHFNRDKDDLSGEGLSGVGRNRSDSSSTRKSLDGSQLARSASPPSFFSTLKSKAGDKEALSKTAKEAMRKWGMNVNWGSKKDSPSGSGTEDAGESTSSSSRLSAPKDASSGHKPRASYAEVRAAVAERREKENQDRSRPTSPSPPVNNPSSSNTPTGLLSPSAAHDAENAVNASIVAAAARLSTPRLATKKSSPSLSRVNTEMDSEPMVPHDTPIKAQPQAKVMAIPGIHARHRGEIQALGHVAEQKPAPTPTPSTLTTTLESKLKNPAMQTVYRFWRSPSISNSISPAPSTSSQQPSGGGTTTSSQDNQVAGATAAGTSSSASSTQDANLEANGREASISQPTPPVLGRPTPPPLPPRSIPVPGDGSPTGSSSVNGSSDSALTSTTPPTPGQNVFSGMSSSPASAALKSIASKDEVNRSAKALEQASTQQGGPDRAEDASSSLGNVPEKITDLEQGPSSTPPPPRGALNASNRSLSDGANTSSEPGESSGSGSGILSSSSASVTRVSSPPPLPPRSRTLQAAAS